MRLDRTCWCLAAAGIAGLSGGFGRGGVSAAGDKPHTTWSSYLGSADSNQYSALKQINKSNVGKLDLAWSYPAGTGTLRFNPIVVDGTMYVLGANRAGGALDAPTGRGRWTHVNGGS